MQVLVQQYILRLISCPWLEFIFKTWTLISRLMNHIFAQHLHFYEPWSIRFARNQFRFVQDVIDTHPLVWARLMCKFNFNPHNPESCLLPHNFPGHPRMKWDDHIHSSCWKARPQFQERHCCAIIVFQIMKMNIWFILPICERAST